MVLPCRTTTRIRTLGCCWSVGRAQCWRARRRRGAESGPERAKPAYLVRAHRHYGNDISSEPADVTPPFIPRGGLVLSACCRAGTEPLATKRSHPICDESRAFSLATKFSFRNAQKAGTVRTATVRVRRPELQVADAARQPARVGHRHQWLDAERPHRALPGRRDGTRVRARAVARTHQACPVRSGDLS